MPLSDSGDKNGEISLGSPSSGCLDDTIFPQVVRPSVLSSQDHVTSQDRTRDRPSTKKIPRPPNSYMIFLSDLRDSNASFKITTSLAGELWRKLSREDKQQYQRRSVQARRQHALQYPAYILQPKKGSDRRPYGSRKTPAQRASKLINASGTSSRTEGSLNVNVVATKCSSRLGYHQPHPDPTHTQSVNSCYHTFGMSSSPSSSQAADTALGLYHVPGLAPQPPFPSPPAPVSLSLIPVEIPGTDSPPTSSQYSSLTFFPSQTPPTIYNTLLTANTSLLRTTQPFVDSQSQYSSPSLSFEQLSLDHKVTSHTSTSKWPPVPIFQPILLPEVRTPDYDPSSFPDLPHHPHHPQVASATAPETHLNIMVAHNFDSIGAVSNEFRR
ncbi:hypothetical protein Clacol_008185 [Clathrus columnatus]|uniref:HMG box domain-containing protein n=1 Tax=Clathrus columnatus TaxID=1419009 RepID=A0AAV5ALF7_9AGAM|nr:hypothetical protein Clacol_008185 [Clathrus columnatus]